MLSTVWLEDGIDVPGSPTRIVGKRHRGATEYVQVGHDTTPS
jgi:hypothetical protein